MDNISKLKDVIESGRSANEFVTDTILEAINVCFEASTSDDGDGLYLDNLEDSELDEIRIKAMEMAKKLATDGFNYIFYPVSNPELVDDLIGSIASRMNKVKENAVVFEDGEVINYSTPKYEYNLKEYITSQVQDIVEKTVIPENEDKTLYVDKYADFINDLKEDCYDIYSSELENLFKEIQFPV